MPATRWSRVDPLGTALSRVPGMAAEVAVTSASPPASGPGTRAERCSSVAAAAAAKATALTTSCVPLRRSRSCPPPICCGAMVTPVRTTSAPTPTGPPHLWDAR